MADVYYYPFIYTYIFVIICISVGYEHEEIRNFFISLPVQSYVLHTWHVLYLYADDIK